jgi:hypothetical protein
MPNMVELIKKAAMEAVETSKPASIVFGTVVSVQPLKINIDQKLTLDDDDLILTDHVIDYDTELSFNDPSIEQLVKIGQYELAKNATLINYPTPIDKTPVAPEVKTENVMVKGLLSFDEKIKHKVTLYNALRLNEKVLMLRVQGGQKYIVLNRWR